MEHRIMTLVKKHALLIYVLCLTIIRMSLIQKGFLSNPDESRYLQSIYAVQHLSNSDFSGFWSNIFATLGRPGDALLNVIPATLQLLLQKILSISYYSQFSFIAVRGSENIAVTICIAFLFWKISKKVFKDARVVFVAVLCYTLLVNSNLYLRHLLPYDNALLLYLFCLYVILYKKMNAVAVLAVGILSGFAYAVYPGYFWFIGLLGILLFSVTRPKMKSLLWIILFMICNLVPIMLLQAFSLSTQNPYLSSLSVLSNTITQGSFGESPYYGALYLIQVEYIIGTIVLGLISLYTVLIFYRMIKRINPDGPVHALVIPAFFMYAMYVFAGAGLHKFVFYGRILHGFFPFILWGGFSILDVLRNTRIKNVFLCVITTFSLISFIKFYIDYERIAYPRDILTYYHISIPVNPIAPADGIFFEGTPFWYNEPLAQFPAGKVPPDKADGTYSLVNFCFFYPVDSYYHLFLPKPSQRILVSVPHFQTYIGYTFEGFSPEERNILMARNYKIKIYGQ